LFQATATFHGASTTALFTASGIFESARTDLTAKAQDNEFDSQGDRRAMILTSTLEESRPEYGLQRNFQ